MGQQQLLLLVLSTVIIAMAILAGIEAFQGAQRQSAINHMTQKSIEIASKVQEYAQRPDHMRPSRDTPGGNDLTIDFSELQHYETVDDGYGGDHVDPYAIYSLNGWNSLPDGFNDDENPCPNDYSHGDDRNIVAAYSEEHDVSVCVIITGTSADDLEARVAE